MGEIDRCQSGLTEEAAKRARWAVENTRRKHNFLPLAMELLKLMAQEQAVTHPANLTLLTHTTTLSPT